MALRTIVQDGDPILKKKCRPVTNYDARLAQLLDDICATRWRTRRATALRRRRWA